MFGSASAPPPGLRSSRTEHPQHQRPKGWARTNRRSGPSQVAKVSCLGGILQTGAAWLTLPHPYPSPATCWRRLKQWEEQDVWLDAWQTSLGTLDGKGLLKWEETFLEGSLAPAKKGALPSLKLSAARAQSGWYWSTVAVFRWEFG